MPPAQRLCDCSDWHSASNRLLPLVTIRQQWVWWRGKKSISTEGRSYCCLTINKQHYCVTAAHVQTDRHTDIFSCPDQSVGDCTDMHTSGLHGMGKSVYAHCLSNIISTSNKQRRHRSNICQHGPSLVRWDGKQELNPLWCCRGKRVTRAILSRTSAFSRLGCNSIPVLNQDLRLHRPTCSLSN